MKNISNFLHHLFPKKMPAARQASLNTLAVLADSEDAMLTCDQVFDLIDQYAERAARGEDVAHLMPLVQAHLEMCPDCREHYEALKRVLNAD